MEQNLLNSLSPETKKLLLNLYNSLIEKTTLQIYNNLDEEIKGDFVRILNSGSEKEKEEFLKKYFADFKNLFWKETKKIISEIKSLENEGF